MWVTFFILQLLAKPAKGNHQKNRDLKKFFRLNKKYYFPTEHRIRIGIP